MYFTVVNERNDFVDLQQIYYLVENTHGLYLATLCIIQIILNILCAGFQMNNKPKVVVTKREILNTKTSVILLMA